MNTIKHVIIGIIIVIALIALVSWATKVEAPANGKATNSREEENAFMITEGLMAEIITQGDGTVSKTGDNVSVHYTGWLVDGTKFDSSVDRGIPFTFTIGAGDVISGWEQGVVGMKVGEKRKLTIAPELAYGDRGAGNVIPPNATLVFEIELLSIN
jgi:FKBP-type peptidyl-prolyl cis-trans isomerase